MRTILIATSNPGKLRDFAGAAATHNVEVMPIPNFGKLPQAIEDGETFESNARKKAELYSRANPGEIVLADDSGLEVDFLNGEPGVRSARFAGEPVSDRKNVVKLLSLLSSCPDEKRFAKFRCVIVLKINETEEIVAQGACKGHIGYEPRGTSGFGYDPVFYPEGFEKTFAELDATTKNSISHRGKAIKALKEKLYERLIIQSR